MWKMIDAAIYRVLQNKFDAKNRTGAALRVKEIAEALEEL